MSNSKHYSHAEEEKHKAKTDAAVTASTPRERFYQAMHDMKANLDSLPTPEAKLAAVEQTYGHYLDHIADLIFGK
jgi:hypothetical protein